ncbi:MAG: RluA family pseudouridine synthase [Marivirga sp.]|nr:RluA family pseudouridine synthase [Marivirga sp.]
MSNQINVPDHILYEDEQILVINKPSGLMVEPDRNGHPNLLQQVKKYIKTSLDPGQEVYAQHIHRLDRPVSGVILFAKKKAVLKNLSEQFAERRVRKYYQALTEKAPDIRKGTLENWLRKEKKKAVIYTESIEYSEAVKLDYDIYEVSPGRFLWNIELHTGKYHQIRGQLSAVGCPVIGDLVYSSVLPYKPDAIALHACRLIFFHPITGEELSIEKKNDFSITS